MMYWVKCTPADAVDVAVVKLCLFPYYTSRVNNVMGEMKDLSAVRLVRAQGARASGVERQTHGDGQGRQDDGVEERVFSLRSDSCYR